MPVTTREQQKKVDIDEELRRLNKATGMPEPPRTSKNTAMLKTLGVLQMLAGLFSIVFSYFTGALFSVFLGAVLAVAGVFQMIAAGAIRSLPALLIGILGTAAGIYFILNPVVSLAAISAIVGIYLIVTGAFNVAGAKKQGESATGGMIEIGIGALVLLGFFGIGLLIGLYLLIRGAINYKAGKTASVTSR